MYTNHTPKNQPIQNMDGQRHYPPLPATAAPLPAARARSRRRSNARHGDAFGHGARARAPMRSNARHGDAFGHERH
jgi:hypothetical protein